MRRAKRSPVKAPPSPATEATIDTSSNSEGASGGRMEGSRASIDLPVLGGPTMSRLCPPAAAISSARLALSCPLISARLMVMRWAGNARPEAISAARHPFARLRNPLVGLADDRESRHARRDLHLEIDRAHLDAFKRNRRNALYHLSP